MMDTFQATLHWVEIWFCLMAALEGEDSPFVSSVDLHTKVS